MAVAKIEIEQQMDILAQSTKHQGPTRAHFTTPLPSKVQTTTQHNRTVQNHQIQL
jgi:hypothetical protein